MPKPESCRECTLFTAPGPVWGTGPRDAEFIYIAQNPGMHEVGLCYCHPGASEPLIGPSGNVFNEQLFKAGVRRERIFITNQVKCLTPNNREPTQAEIKCCKPLLESELARVRSDTVVLAGAIAFKENIGSYSSLSSIYHPTPSIFERMGCVEQRAGRKWIGTIHPAFVMRMPDWRDAAVDHLRKAQLVSGLALQPPRIVEHPTDAQVLELVDYIMLESREFAHDVETVGLENVDEDDYVGADFQLTMCGVGGKPREALVLDPEQVHLLAPIFADPLITRYEHNGPYDTYHEEKILGADNIRARPFDTMLGTHYLRSHCPKKLKPYVLSQYTTLPYYNSSKPGKGGLNTVNERLYNGMDVIATFLAAKEQRRQMVRDGILELFETLGMPQLPLYEEMRRRGVKVDIRKALLFKKVTQMKIDEAEKLLAKVAGPLFNPYSPLQVKQLLYTRLQLPVQYTKDRTPRVTTDYEARKALRWWVAASTARMEKYKVANAVLSLLDFIHGEKKKLEYLDRIAPDGRIHPYYKGHGTKFFRSSSTPNMQNFPVYDVSAWGGARRDEKDAEHPLDMLEEKEEGRQARSEQSIGSLRSIVIADHEEDLLFTCDYAQLQLFIMAVQFNCRWLLDIFNSGDYIYGVIYEKMTGEPFFLPGKPRTKKNKGEISEKKLRRVKAVPLGFLFLRSAEAVGLEYGWNTNLAVHSRHRTLDEECAHCLRDWWISVNPELVKVESQARYLLNQKGWIKHCYGQRIYYPTLKVSEAMASYAQSPEAFIVAESMILVTREFKRRGWNNTRVILQVHDSITCNVAGARTQPQRMIEVAEEIVLPILGRRIPQLKDFQFRSSAEVSYMWDWDTVDYWKWKEEALGQLTRGDVPTSIQSA